MKKILSLALLFCAVCTKSLSAQVSIRPLLKDTVFQTISMQKSTYSEIENAIVFSKIGYIRGIQWDFNLKEFSIYLLFSSKDNEFINQKIALSPADTVTYTIESTEKISWGQKKYVMKFYGKNEAHYNYDWERELTLPLDTAGWYKAGIDVIAFKKHCQNRRNMELAFLETYRNKKTVSNEFYNYARADILNNYAGKLYAVTREYALSSLPKDYFDDTILVENRNTNYNGVLKNKFLFGLKDFPLNYPQEIYRNMEKSDFGNRKELLLTNFVTYYAVAGVPTHKTFLTNIIAKAKNEVKDSLYLANIQAAEQLYNAIGIALPDSVLDNTYLRSQDSEKMIPLRTILKIYEGKALYIDFWASWCSPCRQNIKESEKSCQYLKEQNVDMLYFSVDSDAKSWAKAIRDDNVANNNQYMCNENFRSLLCKYFQVRSIPRYVIFDKEHRVFMIDAPCPIDGDFLNLKKVIENLLAK